MTDGENMFQYIIALVLFHLDTIMGAGPSELKSLGCWIRDKNGDPVIASLEGKSEHLLGNYWERTDPLLSCAKAAASLGYNVFAVSNRGSPKGGECFSSCSAAKDFANSGDRLARCAGGTGGWFSMNVYSLDVTIYLGCIKNKVSGYLIRDMEGTHPALFGQPHNRRYSIEKCAAIARSRGYTVFGVTKGGRCLGSGDAYKVYSTHQSTVGLGKDCFEEKGSDHSISVHLITGILEFERNYNSKRGRFKKGPGRLRRWNR